MSFARPDLLGLAVFLPLLLALALWRYARRRRLVADRLADAALLPRLGAGNLRRFPWLRLVLVCAAGAAVGLAAAGPQWGRRVASSNAQALNVVLALDVSKSMLARDVAPSRLERERVLVRQLLRRLGGDRFGLVVFAGRAYVLSPVTIDHSAIELYLDALDPGIVSQGGSSLQSALLQATDLVRGVEQTTGDRVVILISDGEALEDIEGIRQAAARAATAGVRVYTVGVATRQGATVPDVDPGTGRVVGLKRDPAGDVVRSQLGDDLLRGIAERTHGEYLDIGAGDVAQRLVQLVGGLERGSTGAEQRTEPKNRFGLFIALALLLLALDTLFARLSNRRQRRLVRAAPVLLALLLLGFGIGELERGNRLYRAGRYAEAAAAYREAIRDGRGSAQLHYNLGTALLQLGQYEEAERELKLALADPAPELRQRAAYNLGNRFLLEARRGGEKKQQQYAGAIDAYKQALRLSPADAAAKWNLELALRERDRQQQSPQQQQQNRGGGQQQQPKPSGGEDEKSQNAREQRPMSEAEAERILSAAEQDERDLAREKLRRGQRRTSVVRDW